MPRTATKTEDPLAALASVTPSDVRKKRCRVVRALESLDPARIETLRFLIEESGHSGPRISIAAESVGIRLTHDAIQRHRQIGCKCLAQ